MSWNLRRRLLSGNKDIENRRIVRVTCVLFISGILLTGADAVRSVKQLQPAIERNDYGKGSKTEVLDVKVGDTKKKIRTDIEVSERRYTTEEIQELFGRIIRRMDCLLQKVRKLLAGHWMEDMSRCLFW